jgi:N-acetylglucosaminyl-diphospho-decaprenol L-rhamnosyltransferase
MPAPPVAIAVVSWNTRPLLEKCLRSMQADVEARLARVTVVDNGSTDGSADHVRAEFPWAEVIANTDNVGFGAAVNQAAERTGAPWIAAANADIALAPGALRALIEAGDRHPDAAIIAPRLIDPDGSTQHSVHPFPTLGLTLAFNLGVAQLNGDRLLLSGYWNPDTPRYVDWALGAFILIRRTAWDRLHGFDEQQWMYAEDLDLGWRAARHGWRTWYEPGAHVTHVGAASTVQAWGEAGPDRWLRSTYGWMIRRRGPLVTRTYALLNTAGAAARLAIVTALRRPPPQRAALQAWTRLHATALVQRAADLRGHR